MHVSPLNPFELHDNRRIVGGCEAKAQVLTLLLTLHSPNNVVFFSKRSHWINAYTTRYANLTSTMRRLTSGADTT